MLNRSIFQNKSNSSPTPSISDSWSGFSLRGIALGMMSTIPICGNSILSAQETHDSSVITAPNRLGMDAQRFPFEAVVSEGPEAIHSLIENLKNPAILAITYGAKPRHESEIQSQIILCDGSTLSVPYSVKEKLTWGKDDIIVHWSSLTFRTSSAAVHAIRLFPDVQYTLPWQLMLERTLHEDTLLIRKEPGVLLEVGGEVRAITAEAVHFSVDGQIHEVPHRKVEGIIFFTKGNLDSGAGIIVNNSAGRFNSVDFGMRQGDSPSMVITTKSGATLTSPLHPFSLNRIAATTHNYSQLSSEVQLWNPISDVDAASPLSLIGIPPHPIESDPTSPYGGIDLHGSLKVKIRLRKEYEKVVLGVPTHHGPDSPVVFTSERGKVPMRHIAQPGTHPVSELLVSGLQDLFIEINGVERVRLDPLIFVPSIHNDH